jgi:hypothetical protein
MPANLPEFLPLNPELKATSTPSVGAIKVVGFTPRALRPIVFFAIVLLAMVMGVGSSAAAQCPASPSYAPDFTANQSCTKTNSNAGFVIGREHCAADHVQHWKSDWVRVVSYAAGG